MAAKSKPEKVDDPTVANKSADPESVRGSDSGIEQDSTPKEERDKKDKKSVGMTSNKLKLEASSPGTWGNNLKVKIDYEGISQEVAARYGVGADSLFNLTVYLSNGQEDILKERFQN